MVMIEIKLTGKQAVSLEDTIESHMYFLSCELNGLEEEIPEGWEPFAPYCGCQTCDIREYLMCLTKFLREQGLADIYVEDEKESSNENTLFD